MVFLYDVIWDIVCNIVESFFLEYFLNCVVEPLGSDTARFRINWVRKAHIFLPLRSLPAFGVRAGGSARKARGPEKRIMRINRHIGHFFKFRVSEVDAFFPQCYFSG